MLRRITINGVNTNYLVSSKGFVINNRGLRLKPSIDKRGYLRVSLSISGITKHFRIHRLVALMFIPNPFNLPQVNHIDGNKNNNNVDNLEWVNCSENMIHSYLTGLHKPMQGENHPESKYREDQIKNACYYLSEGLLNYDEITSITGVSKSTLKDIRCGKSWTHISCDYDFSNTIRSKYKKYYNEIDRAICMGIPKYVIVNILLNNRIVKTKSQGECLVYHRKVALNKGNSMYSPLQFSL